MNVKDGIIPTLCVRVVVLIVFVVPGLRLIKARADRSPIARFARILVEANGRHSVLDREVKGSAANELCVRVIITYHGRGRTNRCRRACYFLRFLSTFRIEGSDSG